jgi:hypothetical protein
LYKACENSQFPIITSVEEFPIFFKELMQRVKKEISGAMAFHGIY